MADIDPMLPLIAFGHPDVVGARVAAITGRALLARRNPEEFAAIVRAHIEWAQIEAVARARAGDAVKIAQERAAVPRLTR